MAGIISGAFLVVRAKRPVAPGHHRPSAGPFLQRNRGRLLVADIGLFHPGDGFGDPLLGRRQGKADIAFPVRAVADARGHDDAGLVEHAAAKAMEVVPAGIGTQT